jgi:hypothetical protein
MRIEFHPKASEELVTFSEFYETRVVGLGILGGTDNLIT